MNNANHSTKGCTIKAFAEAKKLPEAFLKEFGISETMDQYGNPAVNIPYFLNERRKQANRPSMEKLRISLNGTPKYIHNTGLSHANLIPYGLWKLPSMAMENKEALIIAEGETDALSALYHGIPCIGISGAGALVASLMKEVVYEQIMQFDKLYLVIEDDGGGEHCEKAAHELHPDMQDKIYIMRLSPKHKDISEVHIAGVKNKQDSFFSSTMQHCMTQAKKYEVKRDEPILKFEEYTVPEFLPEMLPDHLYFNMLKEVSISAQVPLELCVSYGLSLLGTLHQKHFKVEVKPDWLSPINLWLLGLLSSGGGKSPALAPLLAPFLEWERTRQAEGRQANSANQMRNNAIRRKIKSLLDSNAQPTTDSNNFDSNVDAQVEELRKQIIPKISITRIFTKNTTAEAVVKLLAEQKGYLSVVSDEGMAFLDNIAGKYNRGMPNDTDINSCWDSAVLYTDRITRDGGCVREPTVSIGLVVQNDRFKKLKGRQALLHSGHLYRYLVVVAQTAQGYRKFNHNPIPQSLQSAYTELIKSRLDKPAERDDDGNVIPTILKFSNEAQSYYETIWNRLEASTKPGEDNGDPDMQRYVQKAKGNLVRLAGNVNCILTPESSSTPIALSTLQVAEKLIDFFIEHFRVALNLMEVTQVQDDAMSILDWMQRNPKPIYDKQEIWQAKKGKRRFNRTCALDAALALLKQRRYIFEVKGFKAEQYRLNNTL